MRMIEVENDAGRGERLLLSLVFREGLTASV